MSLFNTSLRPPRTPSDEAIERYLASLWGEVEPDPLFRRRLKSDVVNRYVAVREGLIRSPRADAGSTTRAMGRLGRATLYASFALAATGASALAASQEALPGDALYGLKLRVEELRFDVLPAHLHDELAASVLRERTEEMSRLAAAGDVAEAVAMAPIVERAYIKLESLVTAQGPAAVRLEQHLLAISQVLEAMPADAQGALSLAAVDTYADEDSAGVVWPVNNGGDNNTGENPNGTTNNGGDNNSGYGGARHGRGMAASSPETSSDASGEPAAAADATATPRPTAKPKPSTAARPPATPKPTASPAPAHTPDPEEGTGSSGGARGGGSQSDPQSGDDQD